MFDHVTIRVADRDGSERFYEAVLSALGIAKDFSGEEGAEWDDFSLAPATSARPATTGLHIGFSAASPAHVERFWQAGIEWGARSDGEPGPRPEYREDYFGAFLLDPDGNSAEAVHHGAVRDDGHVDHLWIRVADVAASRTFYESASSFAVYRTRNASAAHVQFVGTTGSFSLREGGPTENLHLAFPADRNETVDAFHRELTAAGYRDNGAPGERPGYHAGYYGAFVLDPDGNNIEVVNHNR